LVLLISINVFTETAVHKNPANFRLNQLLKAKEKNLSLEADRFSASQEIPHILWNPKVYYCKVPATCPYSEPDQSSP
jgi:hypothetical protein